ncbi:MAG TPA: DUF202 domain-containing protein [Phycisphaerae bacterium]|nr:DUF202 domain-containing protein [Phycisphaerae bacterium]
MDRQREKRSPYRNLSPGDFILRDHLAIDRTKLANERTVLAYQRTAIMLLVSGITLVKVFYNDPAIRTLGVALLPLGLAVGGIGIVQFVRTRRRIAAAESTPPPEAPDPDPAGPLRNAGE